MGCEKIRSMKGDATIYFLSKKMNVMETQKANQGKNCEKNVKSTLLLSRD